MSPWLALVALHPALWIAGAVILAGKIAFVLLTWQPWRAGQSPSEMFDRRRPFRR